MINDKICGSKSIGPCQAFEGMNFFQANSLESGNLMSSQGRLGLDYNPTRDRDLPSFASYLKQRGYIDKNVVTFGHS